MELRQLEYLVTVADEASFTNAAARLHVAQPGVSAQIRKLEAELGEELLDRSGRTVRPTAVGAAVLPAARAALDAVAGVRRAVDELAGLVRGRVAIGTVPAGSGVDLPELLAGFRARHPGVEIALSEGTAARLVERLRDGGLDVAVVAVARRLPRGLASAVLADQPLVAAVAPGDPLDGRSSVALRALAERSLIALPRGSGVRTLLDDACAAAGVEAHVALEAGDPGVVAELAARGLGVAILPRSFAEWHPAGLRTVAIARPAMRGRIELAWRAEGPVSPAARALVDHARATLTPSRRP